MDESTQRAILEVEDRWRGFKPMLDSYQGREAADWLARLRDTERGMWNAMRNKVYKWMFVRFARREMSKSERGMDIPLIAIGQLRFTDWMYRIYPDRQDPYTWNDEDLKYMLQEIREGAADRPC